MKLTKVERRVAKVSLLGTFSPRRCGIATFTQDLARALGQAGPKLRVDSVAVSDRQYDYPADVCADIPEENPLAYARAAQALNKRACDVLSVQHEYGIYGGEAGSYLLNLVREAKMPLVTTLHTVLRNPSLAQREVLDELMQLSTRVVVMSRTAVNLLANVHGMDLSRVDFIPHGIPAIPASAGLELRKEMGKGPILLTFGLLSPDKGIQSVIKALPQLVAQFPETKYLVVGATHPNVMDSDGERYRESLVALARDLGVEKHVEFVNDFVSLDRLIAYLSATDFYITPYLNPMQITSGTLAYSLGAGKVVISTPYEYAKEVLAEDRGILVPFGCSEAIAAAVSQSWEDRTRSAEMASKAAAFGEEMLWDRVGEQYLDCFERAFAEAKSVLRPNLVTATGVLPKTKLDHLLKLTDDTGLFQHATFSVPNRAEGYCTDDNARALILTTQLDTHEPDPLIRALQARFLSFVVDSLNPKTGRFRNFMSFQRQWLEDSGSEDSQGRALWALGELAGSGKEDAHVLFAKKVFERAAPVLEHAKSPRTWAYAVLGSAALLSRFPSSSQARRLITLFGRRLNDAFEEYASDRWPWMEPRLAYANARVPQALMLAGDATGKPEWTSRGADVLTWLMNQQRAASGCFSPVGSAGAGPSDLGVVQFDQQPVETWASVSACLTASRFRDFDRFRALAHWSFGWFLGRNIHGIPLADVESGACADGLQRDSLNLNQGAESTLSYLCALTELRHATQSAAIATLNHQVRS